MKKLTFLKTMFLAVVLMVGSLSAFAQTTVTHTFSAVSGTIDANISFTTESNGANAPGFYTELRLYSSKETGVGNTITFTPTNGAIITSVAFTKASKDQNPSSVTCSVDGGAPVEIKDTYSISGINAATSVVIMNAHEGGVKNLQMRVTDVTITYTLDVSTPTIFALETLNFEPVEIGSTAASQTITVSGSNLTAGITAAISGADAGQFSVDPATLGQEGGDLTVTYTPSATAATHTATLTLSSTGANDVTVTLNGETTEPLSSTGDGTEANPYTVADVITLGNSLGTDSKYWVKGYIVGVPTGGGSGVLTTVQTENFTSSTAIALADSKDETDLSKMIPIQLPKGAVRTALNLVDNPDLLGRGVSVQGNLQAYFTAPGVKNTSEYKLDPVTGLPKATLTDAVAWTANGKVMLNATAGEVIEVYNVAGQKVVSRLATDGLNEVAVQLRGVAIVKVGNRISKVVL